MNADPAHHLEVVVLWNGDIKLQEYSVPHVILIFLSTQVHYSLNVC